ncbi:MAG: peptide deformylase [Candidatus Margulisiibacteriota bacterium]
MSVLEVLQIPHPVLRQKCVPVTVFDAGLEALVRDMFPTMYHHNGIGLAAPQVGVLQRVLIACYKKKEWVLINPEIERATGSEIMDEGCLSIPQARVYVERYTDITIRCQDLKGNFRTVRAKNILARIFQHELDHLDGVLILDKAIPEDQLEFEEKRK